MTNISHDNELNLLRSILDAKSFDSVLMSGLKEEHFVDETFKKVWVFYSDFFKKWKKIPERETIKENFLSVYELMSLVKVNEPSAFYAEKIIENFVKYNTAKNLLAVLPELEEYPIETIKKVKKIVSEYDLVQEKREVLNFKNSADKRWESYTKTNVWGIPFVWKSLNDKTQGMHSGDLIGEIARPGNFKTWGLIKTALTAWEEGYRVLTIATEIDPLKMILRADAMYLNMDYNLFKKHTLSDKSLEAYKSFLSFDKRAEDFIIADGRDLSVSAIDSLVEMYEPQLLCIDGVYMIEPDRKYNQDWEKVRYLAKELKQLARNNGIPVYYNSQFSRNVSTAYGAKKGKASMEGGLEDIGYGDALGQWSDLMVSVHRSPEDIQAKVVTKRVIKGREAEDGLTWKVSVDFTNMKFNEVEEDQASKLLEYGKEQDW